MTREVSSVITVINLGTITLNFKGKLLRGTWTS
jgi:hypothetical protein